MAAAGGELKSLGAAVVVGGKGMLGTDLVEALRSDEAARRVEIADLPEVDVTQEEPLCVWLTERRPDIVFNCAAYTDVDGCETEQDLAFAVNAEAAGRLARLAASLNARFVHVSTDFVFDGSKSAPYEEDDAPAPLSVYGRSKLEGERLVAQAGGHWLIARTAWLYGRAGRNFVDTMLGLAKERSELSVVSDQVGSPTWSRDLAAALVALAKRGAGGVFHVVNSGACSRDEMVRWGLECAGLSTQVRSVTSDRFPLPARRPPYAPLSTAKFARVVGRPMRPWRDALRQYVTTQSPKRG